MLELLKKRAYLGLIAGELARRGLFGRRGRRVPLGLLDRFRCRLARVGLAVLGLGFRLGLLDLLRLGFLLLLLRFGLFLLLLLGLRLFLGCGCVYKDVSVGQTRERGVFFFFFFASSRG